MNVTIQGIQEAQRANQQIIVALQPSGALGRAIQYATAQAHRYAVGITHVDTGALRASHRMEFTGLRGVVYIDQGSINPNGARPGVYGPIEHARGGSHAFYARTAHEAGPSIANTATQAFLRGLP